jgi:hypothetical protein
MASNAHLERGLVRGPSLRIPRGPIILSPRSFFSFFCSFFINHNFFLKKKIIINK